MSLVAMHLDRESVRAANLALYLKAATHAELATLVGALQAECVCRGIQVSAGLGDVQARIEAAGERA